MKIIKWDSKNIYFSDGSFIFCSHFAEGCEHNYADLGVLSDFYHGEEFTKVFIKAEEEGFFLQLCDSLYFKQSGKTMKIWIPCFSNQNGYYSTELTVYYCDEDGSLLQRIELDCKEV